MTEDEEAGAVLASRKTEAENPKDQPPSSREIPSSKLQYFAVKMVWFSGWKKFWDLKFWASLELGAWSLVLLS